MGSNHLEKVSCVVLKFRHEFFREVNANMTFVVILEIADDINGQILHNNLCDH